MSSSEGLQVVFCTDARIVWGAETSLLTLMRHAPADVVATAIVSSASPLLLEGGVTVRPGPMAARRVRDRGGIRSAFWLLPLDIATSAVGAHRLARRLGSDDVVVCFGTWESFQVLLAARLARRPCILDLHETFEGRFGMFALQIVKRLFDGVIGPTRLVVGGNRNPSCVAVVPRAVDMPAVTRRHATDRVLKVAMIGQIAPHKRVLEVVDICTKLGPHVVQLSVVGLSPVGQRTDYECGVVALAEASQGVVTVRSRVDDVSHVLGESDVLVNASRHEAFGRTVVEALQCGVMPVVVSGTGAEQVIESANVGIVVSNVAALTDALTRLQKESMEKREAASARCFVAGEAFRSREVVPQYFAEIERIVRRAGP